MDRCQVHFVLFELIIFFILLFLLMGCEMEIGYKEIEEIPQTTDLEEYGQRNQGTIHLLEIRKQKDELERIR